MGLSCFLDIGLFYLSLDHQRLVERLVEGRVEVTLLQFTWRWQLGVLDGGAGCGNFPNKIDFGSSRFLSLTLHLRKRRSVLLLLLLGVVTILRTEVYVLIIMVTVLLEGLEVVIGDDTHVGVVLVCRSSVRHV